MSAPQRHTTLHLILTHPGEAQAAHHTLTVHTPTYYGQHILEAAQTLGLRAQLGRRLAFTPLGTQDGVARAQCVWHLHSAAPLGPDAVGPEGAPAEVSGWRQAALTPPPPIPWFHADWAAQALTWLDTELAAQALTRTGEPEVLKHWQISLLWRVPTDGGPVYFKAVPEFFAREVALTPVLAREVPGAAPRVLAADTARGFLLLADSGEAGPDDLTGLLRHLAWVQRASLPLLPTLGLRDRGPAYVRRWLPHLLSDEGLQVGQTKGFTAAEAAALRTRQPALDAALARLAASPLPPTLGHGDLHAGNVTARDGTFTLLDWSDVCATHPFLDANPAYLAPDDTPPEALAAARDVYLAAWTDHAPLDDLRALHEDAVLAGELFRALGYVDGIQGAVPDKTEWHAVHLDHLRRLLPGQTGETQA
ncbi:phosphotransferase [Deinococcus aquaedulcis]|uniref:phosphotransferase n=1 Tax=Deinococcus aquaedulcis TaxID=2840455 RepID=UPI001C83B3EA|nr:phosphotransferase [Deinococcus aquaedulcis]